MGRARVECLKPLYSFFYECIEIKIELIIPFPSQTTFVSSVLILYLFLMLHTSRDFCSST